MQHAFRWNEWNLEHAVKHGVGIAEAESVVRNARPPWPRKTGDEKWTVGGRGQGGRMVRVIYLIGRDARFT